MFSVLVVKKANGRGVAIIPLLVYFFLKIHVNL